MRKPNTKPAVLLSLAILAILLLPLLFYPMRQVIFLSQMSLIRNLDAGSERMEKLVFTPDEFSRLEFGQEGRELRYRGSMYDIKSIARAEGQVIVLALRDHRETRLLSAFRHQDKEKKPATPATLRICFIPYFCCAVASPDLRPAAATLLNVFFIPDLYTGPAIRVLAPPPRSSG